MTNSSNPAASEAGTLPRWLPPVAFAVLTAIVFRAYLISPEGSMLLGQDTLAAGIMFRGFFADQWKELHRLPLWNPYLFGGVPTIEAGSGDILYPAGWLHFLLPLTTALAWKLILHVFLAGVFMYCAARAFGVSRMVALFAGTAYLLGPNLVSLVWGGQDGKMYVITLFPAGLWLLVSGLRTGSLIRFVWLGVVAGLMLLAHPQLAYYAYLALGAYALAAVIAGRAAGAMMLFRRVGGGAVALVTALAIAAIVLLPMYRYLREDSPRAGAGLGYEKAASYSLHVEELVNFVVPDFSGVGDSYWGRNPLKHNSEYGGAVVLALGLSGLLGWRGGDRRRFGLGAMALVALIYALGDTTPGFRLMYLILPGLKNFRAPSLATFIALSAITILSALVLERVVRDRDDPAGRNATRALVAMAVLALLIALVAQIGGLSAFGVWFSLFGSTPAGGALESNLPHIVLGGMLTACWCGIAAAVLFALRRGLLSTTVAISVLTLVTAVDLLRVDSRYIEVVRYADFFPDDPGITALKQSLGPGERVMSFPRIFPTDGHLATYRIPMVFGYHGNQLRWYDELTRRDLREGATTNEEALRYWQSLLAAPVLRALATRVVILPRGLSAPGYESMGGNDQISIYRNPKALAGATVVPKVAAEPDTARQLARMWDPAFDPAAEALVFAPIPEIGQGGGTGSATITLDGADSVVVEAKISGPGMLLISRNWHPSWRATLDGHPAPVVRVDYGLIGVPLPQGGTHLVSLAYRPEIVSLARSISEAGWLGALLLSAALVFLHRREPPSRA